MESADRAVTAAVMAMSTAVAPNPLAPFLEDGGVLLLDGGLATTLEAFGHELVGRLWSAGLLREAPDAIRDAHRAFLEAGADCIATVGYQASFQGFVDIGLSDDEAVELFDLSVALAVEARDVFWAAEENRQGRRRPLVAASVGPYGAYLADGSEYDGRYGLSLEELDAFHRRRFQLLAEGAADLIACETVPSALEAAALLRILDETPHTWAWLSFSCRDGAHISDGTRVEEVAGLCQGAQRVAAIGVNCTAPEHVSAVVRRMSSATGLPVLAYPNSGEGYDASAKAWTAARSRSHLPDLVPGWLSAGARGVGGCCRVGPAVIREIRTRLPVGR